MMVLVDTSIWSLALRRKPVNLNARERVLSASLAELIREGRVQIIGVIRQELLSGIREAERFEKLRGYLRAFDEPGIEVQDYEEAARMHNLCRGRGITGSAIDFLICAVARRREWHIFTTDRDFERYRRVLGLRLFAVRVDGVRAGLGSFPTPLAAGLKSYGDANLNAGLEGLLHPSCCVLMRQPKSISDLGISTEGMGGCDGLPCGRA